MSANREHSLSNTNEIVEPAGCGTATKQLHICLEDGTRVLFEHQKIVHTITWAASGFVDTISLDAVSQELLRNIFDGITPTDISKALVLACSAFIEDDPAYSKVAARLLLRTLFRRVTNSSIVSAQAHNEYRRAFIQSIKENIGSGIFDSRMQEFDLEKLAAEIKPERDDLLEYMGLRTLSERYLLNRNQTLWELPQIFWMRVAMGISYNEDDKNKRAIDFYNTMSQLSYIPSTPTLLHAGLARAQLSSCFLATVEDDLKHIFKCIGDNAQLSKWSGGVAFDWTNVRATGALIQSINVESQGLIPFLKISNDTTAAINRSGKRRSASVVYVESWHLDIEDFLDLRRNTGDERRRTHDINTANWIPDLFIKRVLQDEQWTLFSPDEVPELHHIYGAQFERQYAQCERMAAEGKIKKYKVVEATKLWRKMLGRLFETGHPWITFKDACNIRSPQDHVGVVHSSNLCTEITLNTSAEETAGCNIGSVNLSRHMQNGVLNEKELGNTVKTAMRMLDNVIDITFYPTIEAKNANMRHRPIGIGLMGFQDALYIAEIPFEATQAAELADCAQEIISYHAILTSSELAKERGTYNSYKGSKWDRGIFPLDTLDLLEQERNIPIPVSRSRKLDWSSVYSHVQMHGMRNSNTMAIAPTATISNIAGCFPCIEPSYKNLYVKANMSGEFTVINKYLVEALKKHNLWNKQLQEQIKYFDGSIQMIQEIPNSLRNLYKEAFEIDPKKLIEISALRGRWIDQSQSHNVFMKGVSGKKLHDIYIHAWRLGLKTTYYLRTLSATQIEKATLDAKKFGYTQVRKYQNGTTTVTNSPNGPSCRLEDPDCESCQ